MVIYTNIMGIAFLNEDC